MPASNRLVAVRIGGSGVNMRCQAARRVLAEVDVDLRGSAFNALSGQWMPYTTLTPDCMCCELLGCTLVVEARSLSNTTVRLGQTVCAKFDRMCRACLKSSGVSLNMLLTSYDRGLPADGAPATPLTRTIAITHV